jgi:hypothetical protein
MIWEMKSYYSGTQIDRTAAQNLIEQVLVNSSDSVQALTVVVGDKVSISYNNDRPYIVQKISSSFSLGKNIPLGENNTISIDKWLTDNPENAGEYNPIPESSQGET